MARSDRHVGPTYIDDSKNYHDPDSVGRHDLLLAAKLADQAQTFVFERLG